MCLGKEVLLSFVMMMHISFLASRPAEGPDEIARLRQTMKHLSRFPLQNLMRAEEDYVEYVFKGDPPEEYKSNTLEPLEGVTLPVGNKTEEIESSVCAITDYLTHHLPAIIGNLTTQPQRGDLLHNTEAFRLQFRRAANMAFTKQCHRNISSDSYTMKETGLQIIYFTKKWVKEFVQQKVVRGLTSR